MNIEPYEHQETLRPSVFISPQLVVMTHVWLGDGQRSTDDCDPVLCSLQKRPRGARTPPRAPRPRPRPRPPPGAPRPCALSTTQKNATPCLLLEITHGRAPRLPPQSHAKIPLASTASPCSRRCRVAPCHGARLAPALRLVRARILVPAGRHQPRLQRRRRLVLPTSRVVAEQRAQESARPRTRRGTGCRR